MSEQSFIAVKSRAFPDEGQIRWYIGPHDLDPKASPHEFTLVIQIRLEAAESDPKLFDAITTAAKEHVNRLFNSEAKWASFKANQKES